MPVEFECPHCQQADRADTQKPHAAARRMHAVRQAVLHAMGHQARRHRPAPRRRRQRTLRAGPQFLQQTVECRAVRADESRRLHGRPGADTDKLAVEDQWILSRLVHRHRADSPTALEQYKFADAARVLYDFAWDEFCSFYLEMSKSPLAGRRHTTCRSANPGPHSRRHPAFAPSDVAIHHRRVWQRLNAIAPQRGFATVSSEGQVRSPPPKAS